MPPEIPTDDPNHEQRRNLRADLFQEIACEGDGVVVRSQVADISVGGMFIDLGQTPFAAGSRVTARFALRAAEPRLALEAEVHYVQQRIGMGVRFVSLEGRERDRIAGFVDETTRRKSLGAPPQRKSARVFVEVPIRLRGTRTHGPAFDERTSIIMLSKHGACLRSGYALDVGMKLLLETPRGDEFKGNVVWVGSEASKSEGQAGVQCRGLAQSLGFQFP
ncbi:MAG TPA: PilZ domain-containing protein [Vicinamibacteria bacterium]|nr:PilZ domain-containing protein [Vicinamibacteria bacterium]